MGIGGSSQAARYVIDTPQGAIRFVNLHLETPRKGLVGVFQFDIGRVNENTLLRDIESRRTRSWLGEAEGSIVIAGDFNMPVESAIYRRDWSEFRNTFSEAGIGFGMTKDNGWIQVRIDHIITGADWRAKRVVVGPVVGRGHRPVVADLSWGGSRPPVSAVTTPSGADCATPQAGWIWCDDFEQDRLSHYFEYDTAGGNFVRAAGVGVGGSTGMRARWAAVGQPGAGSLHLAFGKTPQSYFRPVDAGTANYREIYWRMYLKHQPGWIGGGGDKLSRATILASSSTWAQAMSAHVWSGESPGPNQNYLYIDPASGTDASGNLRTTGYNDFANWRYLGFTRSTTPIFDANHAGQWHCVEAYAKLNDSGQSNGLFRLWINGALEAERTGLNWVGAYSAYGINAVFFENYWNGGSPQVQERYFDNIVVSTQPIGCAPSAP
jgi:hypothetical protein